MKILNINNKDEFRDWLSKNHETKIECFVVVKRSKPLNDNKHLYYLDAVYEALCFGWIDSRLTNIDGKSVQRFSPRKKNSNWTALNLARIDTLKKLGKMDKSGLKVLPKKRIKFKLDKELAEILKKERIYKTFKSFPKLYQNIRISNLYFYKELDEKMYQKALDNLIKNTKKKKMYGNWNDYGRLV